MYKKIKRTIFETIADARSKTRASQIFHALINLLIFINLIVIVLESIESLWERYNAFFTYFGLFTVIVFTIEYILCLWSCNIDRRYKGIIKGRLKYAIQPLVVIHLISFVPFYIYLVFPSITVLKLLRACRLFRLINVFQYGKFGKALKLIVKVLRKKSRELILAVLIMLILIFISAVLIYDAEEEAQPEAFGDIPKSMYWVIITLSTVGFGNVVPVTVLGKLLTAIIALLGVALFALPAGIISSGMINEMQKKDKFTIKCPKCGEDIEIDKHQ